MGALRDFVADMLESEGAAIEPAEPDGLDVLVPEPLRADHGLAGTGPPGIWRYAAHGRDADPARRRLARPLRRRSRRTRPFRRAPARLPTLPQHRATRSACIERALDLPNAVWRLHDAKPAWTRCLLLAFRYTAISDEKREGLVWFGFNQGTGAVDGRRFSGAAAHRVGRRHRLARADARHAAEPRARPWDAQPRFRGRVRPLVEHHVRRDLRPFLNAMRRRLDRDRGRIHEYSRRSAPDRTDETCRARVERPATRRRPTASARPCGSPPSSANMPPSSTICAAITLCESTVDWMQGLTLFAPGASLRRADQEAQGRTDHPHRLASGHSDDRAAALRLGTGDRAGAPGLRRSSASHRPERAGSLPVLRQSLVPRLPFGRLPALRTRGLTATASGLLAAA